MKYVFQALILIASIMLAGNMPTAQARIVGPYTPDTNTLHLFHFDGNVSDAVSTDPISNLTLMFGATVTTTSMTGFGTALDNVDKAPTPVRDFKACLVPDDNTNAVTMNRLCGSTGAFTYEALIRPEADINEYLPTGLTNGSYLMQNIISADGSTNRGFLFRMVRAANPGTTMALEFSPNSGLSGLTSALIPLTGPNAFAKGNWYHVAVTYSGTPSTAGNTKFYWTKITATTTAANLIGTGQTNGTNWTATNKSRFGFGNSGRPAAASTTPTYSTKYCYPFMGVIDEARISGIARAADDMMFAANLASPEIDVTPTNVTFNNVNVIANPNGYTTATVTINNTGAGPLTFQTQPGEFKKGIKVTGDSKVTIESVTPDTATALAAGQSVKVVIKFLPTAAGFVHGGDNNHYATLSIFTDDADEAQINLPLRGIAVPVELSTFSAQ